MANNWLKKRLEHCELSTSQLSQILEEEFGIYISRQVLDNWLKMPDNRVPISISNIELVCALITILEYGDIYHFLDALGYTLPDDIELPDGYEQVLWALAFYSGEKAEPIAILLEQIVDSWPAIRELTFRSSSEDRSTPVDRPSTHQNLQNT